MKTLPDLRRPVPGRLAIARAEHRGRAAWKHSADERDRAQAAMEAVVAGTEGADAVQELALAHVIENHVRDEIFWRPWVTPSLDRESLANLRATLGSGRGVLLSRCHLGPFFLGVGALKAFGVVPYTTGGPWLFEPPTAGEWGRRVDRWQRGVAGIGERLINSRGSYELLAALLERGEAVQVYFDMPGGTRTQFLGKPVMLSGGSARLVEDTDALLLPMHLRRRGHRVSAHIGSALDPREHACHEDLQHALAQTHERTILSNPQALEDPRREGAWEHGAGAEEWVRPAEVGLTAIAVE